MYRIVCSGFVGYGDAATAAIDDGDNAGDGLWVRCEKALYVYLYSRR